MSRSIFLRPREVIGRNPQPFCLEKKPLEGPTGSPSADAASDRPTESPGSEPLPPIGPARTCTTTGRVAHVVGRQFVVLDEAAGPIVGLDDEVIAG